MKLVSYTKADLKLNSMTLSYSMLWNDDHSILGVLGDNPVKLTTA